MRAPTGTQRRASQGVWRKGTGAELNYLISSDAARCHRGMGIVRKQEQPHTSKGIALNCSCRHVLSSQGAERTEVCISVKSDMPVGLKGEEYDKTVGGGCVGATLFALVRAAFKRP